MAAVKFIYTNGSRANKHFGYERSTKHPLVKSPYANENVVILNDFSKFCIVLFERVNHTDCIVVVFQYSHNGGF
jgi:hypothetical protein